MTCIIAYTDGEQSFIAGDKLSSDGFTKTNLKQPKVFRKVFSKFDATANSSEPRSLLLGGTTSWRMLQLLEHALNLPDNKREDFHKYLILDVVPVLRSLFGADWDEKTGDGNTPGGQFIIVFDNKIYTIQKDFSVLESLSPYSSVGSGCYHATGALAAFDSLGEVENRIDLIFEIISDNVTTVSKEYDILFE